MFNENKTPGPFHQILFFFFSDLSCNTVLFFSSSFIEV